MEDVKPLLNFYSSRWFHLFCKLIQPLEYLGLNGFCYSVTTDDGLYYSINNNAKAGEVYYSNRLFIKNPFTIHPDNLQHNQSIITKDINSEAYHKLLDPMKKTFGVDNYLIILKKEKGLAHILTFTSSLPNVLLNIIFIR